MPTPKAYFDQLNHGYLAVHRKKEDLFWSTYMGTSNDHAGSAKAETEWTAFLSNADRIQEIRGQLSALAAAPDSSEKSALQHGLEGWKATFEAHALESVEAQELKAALIKAEAEILERGQHYTMTYSNSAGEVFEGSSTVLSANIRASDDPVVRQTSHQALLDLEQWVLTNGFIPLIRMRNQFARSLGFDNFFDYSVKKTEQMTTPELFVILDDFERRTRDRNTQSIVELVAKHGPESIKPYNFSFTWGGDSVRDLDPYVPFSKSLRRWVESFGRLGIDFKGATLSLDLLDRKGKYQNGFCHGPIPSFYDDGRWVAAEVNFTSNAKPDQIGSGLDGIETLFHEGGHAAHFSNIAQNAPCFSQEFAPTSMAYAETQSMFCDSLIGDADWLKTYATDPAGNPVPDAIIRAQIESKQPFSAYSERGILVVPYFEQAIYALDDAEVTPEKLTHMARDAEKRILGLEVAPRPLLAIPHLLSNEAACSYQGYLLANMAVYQTRAYFMEQYGYLTDNPNIGPLLAQHYWNPGNGVSHDATIRSLTGEGFNARYLADQCNLTVDDAWKAQEARIAQLNGRERAAVQGLNAAIKVVDGDRILASNEQSDEAMFAAFENRIMADYGR